MRVLILSCAMAQLLGPIQVKRTPATKGAGLLLWQGLSHRNPKATKATGWTTTKKIKTNKIALPKYILNLLFDLVEKVEQEL